MRRRRPHLTVSLFPFISVLLCTLGALILLLLVLDQTARQQHQLKLNEESAALARQRREAAEEIAARRHAWLQERRGLEEEFSAHEQAARTLQEQKQKRDQELAESKTALATITQRLNSELAETERFEKLVAERSRLVQPLESRQAATQTERERLLSQVRQLERTVTELQDASRQKAAPVHALVPYRGKQGTKRPPIYLEGVGNRLVFRPDGETLWPSDVAAGDKLANRITSRASHLRRSPDESPYVLVLIRPSAINLYYDVLRAIDVANVDVGYELIDEDLQLDFSEPTPEQMAAWEKQAPPPQFTAAGSDWTPGRTGGARGSTDHGSGARTTPGGFKGRPGWVAATGGGSGQGSGGTGTAAGGSGEGPRVGGARGSTGQARVGAAMSTGNPEGNVGSTAATDVKKPVAPPPRLVTTLSPRPSANGSGAGETPGAQPGNQATNPTQVNRKGAGPRLGSPQGSPTPPQPPAGSPPKQGNGGGTEPPGETPPPSLPAPKPVGQGAGPRPIASSGAREFTIVVECLADGVRMPPDKAKVDPAVKGDNNPVLRAVTEQLRTKKKYAPDARPQLVFRIHPDGLRAYYHAAGALATLKLPSSWEIIEAADLAKPD